MNELTFLFQVQKIGKDLGTMGDMTWGASIETKNDKNALITDPMHLSLENGHFDKVPILIGYNSEELIFSAFSK